MHHNIWKPTVCCNWAGLSKAVARMCSLSGDNNIAPYFYLHGFSKVFLNVI